MAIKEAGLKSDNGAVYFLWWFSRDARDWIYVKNVRYRIQLSWRYHKGYFEGPFCQPKIPRVKYKLY